MIKMRESYNFAQDVNPVDFILEESEAFLHRFKNYIEIVSHDKVERVVLALMRRKIPTEMGNYYLVLECSRGQMPDKKAEDLLEKLLVPMGEVRDKKENFAGRMVDTLNSICMAYFELANYLNKETPEH